MSNETFIALRDGRGATIQDLFAEQAAHTPEATAIVHPDGDLTYAELNACANRLARRLHESGLSGGAGVAFMCDRTPLLPIALLGILKARGHYIPLDPTYPVRRINGILDDARPFALVTDRTPDQLAELGIDDGTRIIHLTAADAVAGDDPDPVERGTGGDLVYSIYTSGSTGKPKGTLNLQRGVVNINRWMFEDFGVGPDSRFLVVASIGFDATSKALCSPLLTGGSVVLYDSPWYDPPRIRRAIVEHRVNGLAYTPTGLFGLIEDGRPETYEQMSGLERLMIGGEALHLDQFRDWLTHPSCRARLVNGYGATECADQVAVHDVTAADLEAGGICPLGTPIPNVVLTVRDRDLNIVPAGEKGELCMQGVCLGAGYRNLPEQTAAAFVPAPESGEILYRSGDLVSRREDGVFVFHGRMDFQVKIRGQRVELGEIEQALNRCPGVLESVVTAPEKAGGERFVAAYIRADVDARDPSRLNELLAVDLPDYMLPTSYTFLDSFPVNASHKVDRSALPAPVIGRPPLGVAFRAPAGAVELALAELWDRVLGFEGSGADDPFFEVGGNSLLATRLTARIGERLGVPVPIAEFFETPTIAGLARGLSARYPEAVREWTGAVVAPKNRVRRSRRNTPSSGRIAIVGMAARLPGADDVAQFWRNLCDGVESLDIQPSDDPSFVRVSGWINDADAFDHNYFGYTPYEAERIDPQQRLLLEVAASAFEDAAIPTSATDLRAGIYASVAPNTYLTRNVMPYDGIRDYGLGYALVGNDKDYAATRIAYKLGLNGPALTVQTACSSSGVALHLACQALLTNDCDVALAGGASLPWQYQNGHEHTPGGALSADGHIRAFDADASGMVLTAGGACLVLRRLEDAIEDGHTIYAVIRSTALNNDGADKASFTAPSIAGQRSVIRAALDRAGVNAREIGVLEAHGTGTPLGDPIEVAAITQAWREDTPDTGYCAIGSVKTNIGHLDAAAASAGAIKLALMLRHAERPATLNVAHPNPECRFDESPFVINTTHNTWESDTPRLGALSSFGFGGTNFHAIFEEPPHRETTASPRPWHVLRLSAKTEDALRQQVSLLEPTLDADLADIAYTLDVGRNRHPFRAAVVASSAADARQRLRSAESLLTGGNPHSRPTLIFTFPGQGAQHAGMGRRLYETEVVFRDAVDECAEILAPELNVDLRDIVFSAAGADALRETQLAQPAIFTISYATAKLWLSWGLTPDAMIGHSVGEFVAATLTGVFDLKHALMILAERARLMQSMPSGGMLAVRLPEDAASEYLDGDVAIAGVNSPHLTVLSGPHDALDAVKRRLEENGVATTSLHTSHAFHSPMMEPIVESFAQVVAQYPRSAPNVPFHSSLTGLPITPAQAQDPVYWAQQLRNAVRFAPALVDATNASECVILECGPGQNLTTSARQTLGGATVAIASLPHSSAADADDADHLAGAVARLYLAGVDLDPERFYAGQQRMLVPLPTYPFARTRHWLLADAEVPRTVSDVSVPVAPAEVAVESADSPDDMITAIRALFADVAGVDIGPDDGHRSFLELGFDSLLLTQVTSQVNQRMKVTLRFRQLLEEFSTPASLAEHLTAVGAGLGAAPETAAVAADEPEAPPAKVFGAGAKITTAKGEALTKRQRAALDDLIERYTAHTASSRAYADANRPHLADPRAVTGFRPLWKDLVYPIVSATSKGPRFTDIDGNEYVDLTNGFGSIFFGHRPDFLVQAVHDQVETDIIIGPQNPVAGECAKLFAELTGHERVAFCNTGSEAVLAAIRVARTVTGRNLIVQHEGDYHGIFDEVLVRGTPSGRSIPAAPGVPRESVANTLMLDYGDPKSLEILRERAHEIAAVVIEPVQSRKPDFQPADYVREVRKICDESGTALIMDEVICGFRVHTAGAQGVWGVKADIGCYGKVFGAGMPVGALAGNARFLDALDGGSWQFGDDSMPEVGVTYFAGTFVRHPLTMAVVHAALRHLKENPGLQEQVNNAAKTLVDRLNRLFDEQGVPLHMAHFGSLMKPEWTQDLAFGELLYYFLREAGVNAQDGRPNYLTTTHGPAEIDFIVKGFEYAITQMRDGGFLDDVSDGTITVPSTESQREVWLAARFVGNNSVAYNEGLSLHLDGALDEDALRYALQTLLDRHDALRSHFSRDGRTLVIRPKLALDLPTRDLSFLDGPDRDAAIDEVCNIEMGLRFHLSQGPLFRFTLVRLDDNHHRLLLVTHHAVCDGWSGAVMLTELAELYSARVEGRVAKLAPAPRYADYTVIENEFLQSPEGHAHQNYWIEQLRNVPAPPQLPPDRVPETARDLRAARVDRPLDIELVRQLRTVGSSRGASMVATMLTGFASLFQHFTGQNDLVIGLAAAGQSFHDQTSLVGHCVNLLPLRVRLDESETFEDALRSTRNTLLDAFDHQGVTFGTLLPQLDIVRDRTRPPLVSVVFNIDVRDDDIHHTGLEVSYETLVRQAETFELFINVVDFGSSMILEASYQTALYSEDAIVGYLEAFEKLLRRACADPTTALALLSAEDGGAAD